MTFVESVGAAVITIVVIVLLHAIPEFLVQLLTGF